MIRAELHAHTADDPSDRVPFTAQDLIVRAAALGYGAIAITLHDAVFDPAPLAAFARQHGVRLLPGVERTVQRAHVLLINFPAAAAMAVHRLEDIAALKAAHPHGLVVAPHPCYPIASALGRRRLDAFAPLWDAIEVNALHVSPSWMSRCTSPLPTSGRPLASAHAMAARFQSRARTCSAFTSMASQSGAKASRRRRPSADAIG